MGASQICSSSTSVSSCLHCWKQLFALLPASSREVLTEDARSPEMIQMISASLFSKPLSRLFFQIRHFKTLFKNIHHNTVASWPPSKQPVWPERGQTCANQLVSKADGGGESGSFGFKESAPGAADEPWLKLTYYEPIREQGTTKSSRPKAHATSDKGQWLQSRGWRQTIRPGGI